MTGGRPLRFLAILLCGWAAARGVDIYRRGGPLPPAMTAVAKRLAEAIGVPAAIAAPWTLPPRPVRPEVAAAQRAGTRAASAFDVPPPRAVGDGAALPPQSGRTPTPPVEAVPALAPAILPPTRPTGGSRWSGSAWLIARNGGATGVPGGQLGASQAGVRVLRALGRSRRLAIAGRLSAPLSGRGREAAIGVDWQPTGAPIHLIAEQRVALDGGPNGPMAGIVAGFGPAAVAPGVTIEAYGQAGVVVRTGGGGFADGAVRVAHPLATVGGLAVDIAAGLWGGAQRGASRLDIGPSLGLVVPLGGRRVRLSADWRQRIAGDARPGSGPALSIGTDF